MENSEEEVAGDNLDEGIDTEVNGIRFYATHFTSVLFS